MLNDKTYTIATGNKQSTQAAADILDAGGNAYDAILAALFMSFVSEPLLSSPGGGGYLLAHPIDKEAMIFDFFAQTPHNKEKEDKDFYPIQGDFGTTTQEFHIGMASVAIPGIPAGIFAIHDHLGTMPLIECAQAAINQAKTGVIVDNHNAQVIKILSPIINASCCAKAIFANKDKQLLVQGDKQVNNHLADFIKDLATNPMDWFYQDTPATNIVNDMHHNNGLLSIKDFENYQAIVRKPLMTKINNWNIMTNAAPTSGGLLITKQLQHAFDNDKGISTHHKIVQAMVYADKLKNDEPFQSSKGTTHMSIIDAMGNVASMTVSNGEGSGYVVPNCGFMLNNFLGEEDINTQGFFNFQENTRMASMMSPTILEKKDCKIALGTGGSNRIKTVMFQVIWHLIVENKSLKQAINQARLHFENGVLDIEKGVNMFSIESLSKIFENVNQWQQKSLYFGGVNAVQKGLVNYAIGDSRRNGVGIVNLKV